MIINKDVLKEILVGPGHITENDFLAAANKAAEDKRDIIEILVEKNLITDEQIGRLSADYSGYPFASLKNERIDEKILNLIPEAVARSKKIIVFRQEKNEIKAGMVEPEDMEMRHNLEKKFDLPVKIYLITEKDWRLALDRYKNSVANELNNAIDNYQKSGITSEEKDKLVVDFVNSLLDYGDISKASDIHIEPQAEKIIIRFRIDGVMHRLFELPKDLFEAVTTRIKILSRIRIDEHRSAQDGKFRHKIGEKNIDVRVSVVPVVNGENIVMRVLSAQNRQMNLSSLGFWSKDFSRISEAINDPHGLILSTGPTGCGKTTTIYELLKTINKEDIHIATIEDPVEYDIEGVSQIQVDPKSNLTFAKGLRAIVRQDPDVILVGEIRDQETAQIAINSALTGHLVLSTLHTNDAATTLPRLLDMGIEPFLIASTVNMAIGQRLVRKICEKCRYSYEVSEKEIEIIKNNPLFYRLLSKKNGNKFKGLLLFKGAGCSDCAGSGYQGRIGVFEILLMSDTIKELILKRASSDQIKAAAQKDGMTSMLEDGVMKALNGLTTIEEVIRATSGLEKKY